ncbi:MAG TPA: DUF6268 family outer membrane beta-barrel protein, partial [Chlamydiales bacterium]|nr:DUF6268 family outer membrane beta-barrel protein [Chlamydiales bacterium]
PLHVGGNLIYIGDADVTPRHTDKTDGDLHFSKANAYAVMLVPLSRTTYLFPRVEWNTFTMDWDKNPKFKKTQFYYFQFALTLYTIALEKWRWIARADYNLDQDHLSHLGSYGLFSALLWGSYQFHRKWHYHVGALGYVGMQGDTVYPVIGFDYAPNKKWLFQAIFPMTYTIDYNYTEHWRFSLKGRPLRERFRVGNQEPQAHSIFNYSTIGAEFNAHYEILRRFEAEAFIGYNFGGSFYIKDRGGRNALYTDVSGAPYVGAMLDWGF